MHQSTFHWVSGVNLYFFSNIRFLLQLLHCPKDRTFNLKLVPPSRRSFTGEPPTHRTPGPWCMQPSHVPWWLHYLPPNGSNWMVPPSYRCLKTFRQLADASTTAWACSAVGRLCGHFCNSDIFGNVCGPARSWAICHPLLKAGYSIRQL